MRYSIVYSSVTGNTALLANTIHDALPQADCIYFGTPDPAALKADRIYIGFWTNKGTCDSATAEFMKSLTDQQVFLFGTAGYGSANGYYEKVLDKAANTLPESVTLTGRFLCQGKMPVSVRERYESLQESGVPHTEELIENFDQALSHPDAQDLAKLRIAVENA